MFISNNAVHFIICVNMWYLQNTAVYWGDNAVYMYLGVDM